MGKKKGTLGRKEIAKSADLCIQKLIISNAKFLEWHDYLINLTSVKIGDTESSDLVLRETTDARNKLFGSFVTLKNNWNECNRLAASADEHSVRDALRGFIHRFKTQIFLVESVMSDVFNICPNLT